ncbi:hypothetical protein [Kitasatospora cheerisanensis]|nr:hypothetical protein [Kitasatospora cheerisanensis]
MPKKPKPPRAEELAAEAVVNHVLGTTTLKRDDNSAPAMIDALLGEPGQVHPTIALEITSTFDKRHTELGAALRRHYGEKEFPQLTGSWVVEFTLDSRVGGRDQKALLDFLAGLEHLQSGKEEKRVTRVSAYDDGPLAADLRALNLASVTRIDLDLDARRRNGADLDPPRRIGTLTISGYNVGDFTAYVDDFLRGATAKNKLDKLQRAKEEKGLRTLLFAWADSMTVGMALRRAYQPPGKPAVPAVLDELWLANPAERDAVFRWTQESAWELVSVPGVIAQTVMSKE